MNISSFSFPCDTYCPDWITTYLSSDSSIKIFEDSDKQGTAVKSGRKVINFKIV